MVLFFWLNVWYSKTILRKGTETVPDTSPCRGCHIAIYPRKGTETEPLMWSSVNPALQFIPAKPSQALRASSPEGRAFPAAVYPDVKLPLSGELARRKP